MEETTSMTDAWIAKACKANPITQIKVNGEPNGNFRTGPVRLSFPHLFKPQKPMQSDDGRERKPVYSTALLFPPHADLTLLNVEAARVLKDKFPQYPEKALHKPFRDGGEKPMLAGYEPGWTFFTVASQYRPAIVDTRMAPIVDEERVYPGVWAICSINAFDFTGKNPQGQVVKRGVSFGLQSVMIIADDVKLGGVSSDPNADFAGVSIDPVDNAADLLS